MGSPRAGSNPAADAFFFFYKQALEYNWKRSQRAVGMNPVDVMRDDFATEGASAIVLKP